MSAQEVQRFPHDHAVLKGLERHMSSFHLDYILFFGKENEVYIFKWSPLDPSSGYIF